MNQINIQLIYGGCCAYVLQINSVWLENLEGLFQNRTDKVPDLTGRSVRDRDVGQIAKHKVELCALFDVTIQRNEAITHDNLQIK